MIWTVSWKNVWRNRIRSSLVIAAFIVGIFGGVYTVAIYIGMIDQRLKAIIGNEVSHMQIHNPGYLDNNELKYTIDDYPSLINTIQSMPEVKAVSPRVKIMGMASTSGNASGVIINGINIESEKQVTDINRLIVTEGGSFFEDDGKKPIVIGEKLAKTLKLVYFMISDPDLDRMKEQKKLKKIVPLLDSLKNIHYRTEQDFELALESLLGKQKVKRYSYRLKKEAIKYKLRKKTVLSFQALDGHLAYDAFRIAGIYKTANTTFDGLNIYVRKDDISDIASMSDTQVNEIALVLHSIRNDHLVVDKIKSSAPELSVQTWDEIMPEAGLYAESMDFYLMIFLVIILLALGFGIVNTMLMAVLERMKELGMLMAIGMNKKRVFSMIMLETVFLAMVGAVIGMVITYLVIWSTSKTGIDLTALYGDGFEMMGFSAHLFPKLNWNSFFQVMGLVILTGILASIYPARKALKLKPAESLRIDM